MFGRQVIEQVYTDYGTFTVEELNYEGRPARVLFSAPMHTAQSGIPLDNNPRLLFDYNRCLLELAIEFGSKKILVLGGGTMTLPMALIDALSKTKVTVVEINHKLVDVAKKHFGFRENSRLELVVGDAEQFVAANKDKYSLILVDLYDNFTIPQHFRSLRFASSLKNRLDIDGLVATNCISSLEGEASRPLRQLSAAYSKEIGQTRALQADNEYFHWSPQNLIILATNGKELPSSLLKGCLEVPMPALTDEDYII